MKHSISQTLVSAGAHALIFVLCLQLALGPQIAAAQAVSGNAGVAPIPTTTTTVTQSANDTPVVNIAAPNAAGVSHNTYSSYNVGADGLILNNSATNAVSLIGGGVIGNSNLADGRSASLILNEVTSANAGSILAGYQEIVGPAAELVVANPWGITCNGCGFINTPRVTLTTGAPTLSGQGALAGFTITGGRIAIVGDGLDATRQSALDLLARSIEVGGNVVVGSRKNGIGGDLQVLAGANTFDYATRSGTAIAGSGAAPDLAIDSSALGGMYADRIRLLVNEQGAGVRIAGDLAALADDLSISANGRIDLRGSASAARDIAIRGQHVQLALPDAGTYIYAGRDLNVSTPGTLSLASGSFGAANNVLFNATYLADTGTASDLRFGGATGSVEVNVLDALNIGGGYWTGSRLLFNADSLNVGGGAVLYGRAATGNALILNSNSLLSLGNGQLFSSSDLTLNSQRLVVGAPSVVVASNALTANVARGFIGGIDNAGQLQGLNVDLHAIGDPGSTPTTFVNHSTGEILSTNALSIHESGSSSALGNSLLNEGVISGGDVTVATTQTSNINGTIEAKSHLNLLSGTLRNEGENAVINGSSSADGGMTIAATSIFNSGTIWSAGDLLLQPLTLQQQRVNGSATNPYIGAGRDLTIAFSDRADLGAGGLQAGRDLTITGSAISDSGATSSNSASGDLRYAGRNLSAIAAPGGDVDLGGGQWYSQGDLRFVGEQVNVGSTAQSVDLVGTQGGSGTLQLNARNGMVRFFDGSRAFSGDALDLTQTALFGLGETNVLQADGLLSINAGQVIENWGTIAGGTVDIRSNNNPLRFFNRSSGTVIGTDALNIGLGNQGASLIQVDDGTANNKGLYGGALTLLATRLDNFGTIQGFGGVSTIQADNFYNAVSGRITTFGSGTGTSDGALTIRGRNLTNEGLLYSSISQNINVNNIVNAATGSIASAGYLTFVTTGYGGGSSALDNLGSIYGDSVQFYLANGLLNGRDRGIQGNLGYAASIYAQSDLFFNLDNGSSIQNYNAIRSGGNIRFNANGGSLRNELSLPAYLLAWDTGGSSHSGPGGDLGFYTRPGAKHTVVIDGVTYYYFDSAPGDAYRDTEVTYSDLQYVADPSVTITRPIIEAAGNIVMTGFQDVVNIGSTISAGRDLSITSQLPGASISNESLQLSQRDRIVRTTTHLECRNGSNNVVDCSSNPDHVSGIGPVSTSTSYANVTGYRDLSTAEIHATGNFNVVVPVGSVTNSGSVSPFNPITNPQQTRQGTISVTEPGAAGAHGGATILNLNGAQIPLPTTQNGAFIIGKPAGSDPLIESNPLFGIDSIALGSEYLVKLLGLKPEDQLRRLGDDNYEAYLIQQQIQAATGRGVLDAYWGVGDMVQTLFDNAGKEATTLSLGFGKALTSEQIASLKSDIVWMVEQEIQGQKVLVPVVYLSDATRAGITSGAKITGGNVNITAGSVKNVGGQMVAANALNIKSSSNIENISGRMAGWNVNLDAKGDIVNSTMVNRVGDAVNGRDFVQRTATIEAGGTAKLLAGRDINVSGAWVAAGKDAWFLAERNVNVESLVATYNYHAGDDKNSSTTQTQVAHGGGVVAGGNLGLQGGQDVNIKGADIAADGRAILYAAKGNVNVGVQELTNSSSETSTTTGRYDEIDRDPNSGTLGIGLGKQKKTTTQSQSTTVGVGSNISGKGVQIVSGKGDVNIVGSGVTAGEEGIFVDSADDVNIAAYHDKSESSSSSTTKRTGVRIDGSMDGIYAGSKESSEKISTTTTQTTARTSSLSSGGGIVVRGKGDVTNEGTKFDAVGDVYLEGENIVNKAAQDTYSSSTTTEKWESKQQTGFTTNGTGSSIADAAKGKSKQVTVNNLEAQARVTGSGSKETTTTASSTSKGTTIKAGGNVVVNAKNNASDEGTKYEAGKNIIISAESYENKAAADTSSTSSEQTWGSGQLTAGLNSAAEVAVTTSAEGGHEKSSEVRSTANTGGMKAGGRVIVEARSGNVTLEGTDIAGQQGVGITAAGDIKLLQANDTVTTSSSGESGSARLSGSVSVLGTGGSVGAGASTRQHESEETSSTANAGSIRSGGGSIRLQAGRDIASQGTDIEAAGNVGLKAGGNIDLAAATDTIKRTGSSEGGGVDVNVGFGTGAAKGNGSVGVVVDAERSKTDYKETTEHGSKIKAGGQFSIDAGGDGRLEGTQVEAGSASLRTGGQLTLESAQHTVKDDSYSVVAHVEASGSKGGGVGGASTVGQGSSGTRSKGGNAGGGNTQVDVTRSYQDIEQNTNATIKTTGGTEVNVGGDMTLAGANINAAGGVSGKVAGNLTIETRVDKENIDQSNVSAYAGAGPIGGVGGTNKFDKGQNAVQGAANNVGQTGVFADVNSQKKDNLTVGTASGINGGSGGIDLSVGKDTKLVGATNQGGDFKTQGQTTVTDVETRTKESSTDFRAPGTVATALGSDKGKGGDFGLSLNMPNDGDAPRTLPKKPGDVSAPTDPRTTRPGSNGGDVDSSKRPVPVQNTSGIDGSSLKRTLPAVPTIKGDNDVAPPAAPRLTQNEAPTDNNSARKPPLTPVTPDTSGNAVIRAVPKPPTDIGGEIKARVLPPNNGGDTNAIVRATPDVPRANDNTPVVRDVPNQRITPADDNSLVRTAGNPKPARNDDGEYNSVGDKSPVETPVNRVEVPQTRAQSEAEAARSRKLEQEKFDRIVRGFQHEQQLQQYFDEKKGREADRVPARERTHEQNLAWYALFDAQSLKVIQQDPRATALLDLIRQNNRKPREMVEQTHVRRNLAEIVAYSRVPGNEESGKRLLEQFEASLRGTTKDAQKHTLFPLHPQYVGESVMGFDTWYARKKLAPGVNYGENGSVAPPIHYFSAQEQARNQVVVRDGKLTYSDTFRAGGGRLEQLDSRHPLIFVITEDGRMIVSAPSEGSIHHSSLAAGKPVRLAGELTVDKDGNILEITNKSGHFRPDDLAFKRFLGDLIEQGFDISKTQAFTLTFRTSGLGGFMSEEKTQVPLVKSSLLKDDPRSALVDLKTVAAPPARRNTLGPALQGGEIKVKNGSYYGDDENKPKDGSYYGDEETKPKDGSYYGDDGETQPKEGKYYGDDDAAEDQGPPDFQGAKNEYDLQRFRDDQLALEADPARREGNDEKWTPKHQAAYFALLDANSLKVIAQDPEASALLKDIRDRKIIEQTYIRRNLAEIVAYSRVPGNEESGKALLAQFKTSLHPPQAVNGQAVFALHPQYVGESVSRFDAWFARPALKPGVNYSHPEKIATPVHYFTPSEQAHQQVIVRNGKLEYAAGGRPLTQDAPNHPLIFVVTDDGRLIVSNPEFGETHHSSLSAGKPVRLAGEITVDEHGNVLEITNKSGHFRPDAQALKRFLADLQAQGFDARGTKAASLSFVTTDRGGFNSEHKTEIDLRSTLVNDSGSHLVDLKAPAQPPSPSASDRSHIDSVRPVGEYEDVEADDDPPPTTWNRRSHGLEGVEMRLAA